MELVHNFSLLHDDIIDGDAERRHRPTVWAVFSQGEAIIVGDALHALAFDVLLSGATEAGGAASGAAQAAARLASATAAMIAGQSRDMAFNERMDVTPEQCLAMEADKTGALLGYASSVGAVLAGADVEVIAGLEGYGSKLGLAFQAADDLLGIWGDPAVTGKPVGNDLRERKKSFPVVVALSQQSAASEELAGILSQDATLSEAAITRATQLVEQAGGKELTSAAAHEYLNQALACMQAAPIAASAVEELTNLARFVVARDH